MSDFAPCESAHAAGRVGGALADDDLRALFRLDVRDAAPAAIQHANMCGGADNITALFVEFVAGA